MHFSSVGRSDIGDDALDLMARMLVYNPDRRITAQQCLQHSFFSDIPPYLRDMQRQKTLGRNRGLVNNSRNQPRNMQSESPIDELTNLNRESKISQIMQQNSDLNHLNMNEIK